MKPWQHQKVNAWLASTSAGTDPRESHFRRQVLKHARGEQLLSNAVRRMQHNVLEMRLWDGSA